jgi:hypothetical protein
VRSQPGAQAALAPSSGAGKVRILLAICRPGAGADVPFRSVSSRIVKGLSDKDREAFQLDVLRPPTYEQLARVLKLAQEKGEPHHIVHFDGHGVYADPKKLQSVGPILSNLMLKGGATGPCGYLAFEDPGGKTGSQFVDGFALGGLLRDAGVPILILNACQSAFAEAQAKPKEDAPETALGEIEAYGSLGQAVVNAGAAGVVAMRYSVYVVTAAQFVAELYGALARGRTLGEAVAFARGNLHDKPDRKIAYDARPLQDWVVPVVWERTPLRLWPQQDAGAPLRIMLEDSTSSAGALDRELPKAPDVGFFGRDETLYALDRAFDAHRIVLLHAFAGSGKTATAAEFARWYSLTGGMQGPVLFTSFERHLPLPRVLDKIGEMFGPALERSGVQWGAVTDEGQRRQIALDVMRQIPVLWIWDNAEPITGFPAGSPSDWSAAEQKELRDFLSDARDTQAKFLLTSRRDEQAWLGDMPRRVEAPPMPMQERLQLAGAIIEHRGKRLADLPDLTPLLQLTQGNPLTILVTVGEALRAGIDSKDRLDEFVASLRSGKAKFEDEESEGRTKSLGASLSYGFARAFNDDERKQLALLHLFQGFVDVDVLRAMGDSTSDWALDEVRGLTREQGISLLGSAGEIGLLIPHGGGYYGVHPALPWYFRDLFERYYVGDKADLGRRAFVEATGELASHYHGQYTDGNHQVLSLLIAEEDNILAAWRLARKHGWWRRIISTMQGLRVLYREAGRGPAWRRLVEAVTPDFVDPQTDRPLPGREHEWSLVTEYRVRIAREDRDFVRAARLQSLSNDWRRTRASDALVTVPELRTDDQRGTIRDLSVSFHELGQTQFQNNDPACADSYRESLALAQATNDRGGQASCAYNLGVAYMSIAALRDFDSAEHWLQQSLDLRPSGDNSGRGKALGQLGGVALERWDAAIKKGSPQRSSSSFSVPRSFATNRRFSYFHRPRLLIAESLTINLVLFTAGQGILTARCITISRTSSTANKLATSSARDTPASMSPSPCWKPSALATRVPMPRPRSRTMKPLAAAPQQTFNGPSDCLPKSTKLRPNSEDKHDRRLDKPPCPRRDAARGRRSKAKGSWRRRGRRGAGARPAAVGDVWRN